MSWAGLTPLPTSPAGIPGESRYSNGALLTFPFFQEAGNGYLQEMGSAQAWQLGSGTLGSMSLSGMGSQAGVLAQVQGTQPGSR